MILRISQIPKEEPIIGENLAVNNRSLRPGYNFNVMVAKDIILSACQGHPIVTLPFFVDISV